MGALAAVRRAPARRASPAGGVQRGTTQPAGHAVRWPDLDGLPGFGGGAGGPAAFVVVGVPAGTGAPADGAAFGDERPAPLAYALGGVAEGLAAAFAVVSVPAGPGAPADGAALDDERPAPLAFRLGEWPAPGLAVILVTFAGGCGWGCPARVGAAGAVSPRRPVVTDTATASATACNVAPRRRRLPMSRTISSVNREGPLGPGLSVARPAAPGAPATPRQRPKATVETPNAAATSVADAALIRTSWTAASRRPPSSPASHALHSSPRMNARPPSSSCNNAATFPNGTAPAGVRGRGGWAVIKPTNPTPQPVEYVNLIIAAEGSQT